MWNETGDEDGACAEAVWMRSSFPGRGGSEKRSVRRKPFQSERRTMHDSTLSGQWEGLRSLSSGGIMICAGRSVFLRRCSL